MYSSFAGDPGLAVSECLVDGRGVGGGDVEVSGDAVEGYFAGSIRLWGGDDDVIGALWFRSPVWGFDLVLGIAGEPLDVAKKKAGAQIKHRFRVLVSRSVEAYHDGDCHNCIGTH